MATLIFPFGTLHRRKPSPSTHPDDSKTPLSTIRSNPSSTALPFPSWYAAQSRQKPYSFNSPSRFSKNAAVDDPEQSFVGVSPFPLVRFIAIVNRRTISFSVRGRSLRQSIFPSLMPLSFFTFFSFVLRIHRKSLLDGAPSTRYVSFP